MSDELNSGGCWMILSTKTRGEESEDEDDDDEDDE